GAVHEHPLGGFTQRVELRAEVGADAGELVTRGLQFTVDLTHLLEELEHRGAISHAQLTADEVGGLHTVGAFVDGGDAHVTHVLRDAGFLDVAHASEDLNGGGGEFEAHVSAPALTNGGK